MGGHLDNVAGISPNTKMIKPSQKIENRSGRKTAESKARVVWLASAQKALADEILEAHGTCTRALATGDKGMLRAFHCLARSQGEKIAIAPQIVKLLSKHRDSFKVGSEINVAKIRPVLRLVETLEDEQLWLLAKACWSMPYSKGYGRRLRFLVVDEEHQGLIGILGLQSPPADLRCRDDLFDYPKGRKLELVNQTMDAYTIGAIPPYSFLLGGKLCAGILSSDQVREAYWRKYAAKTTQMEQQLIKQPLVAITTTSAFGRSSIYNRLKFEDRLLAQPIGFTKGYGMLHLEHLYPKIRSFLDSKSDLTPNGYGNGPKVRWQNVTKALQLLGLPIDLLAHGIRREVFLFSLVEELADGMNGKSFGIPRRLSVDTFSAYWLDRWAIPRANRYPEWVQIDSRELVARKILDWPGCRV
jgi:Domain of unknown function (DUF4338)